MNLAFWRTKSHATVRPQAPSGAPYWALPFSRDGGGGMQRGMRRRCGPLICRIRWRRGLFGW